MLRTMAAADTTSMTTSLNGGGEALAWAFDASPDLVFAATSRGEVLYLNGAARAYWSEAAVGAPASRLLPGGPFREAEAAARSTGEAVRFEWGDEGPGGVRRWFGCTLSPLRLGDADVDVGADVGILCVSSDRTELKRSVS